MENALARCKQLENEHDTEIEEMERFHEEDLARLRVLLQATDAELADLRRSAQTQRQNSEGARSQREHDLEQQLRRSEEKHLARERELEAQLAKAETARSGRERDLEAQLRKAEKLAAAKDKELHELLDAPLSATSSSDFESKLQAAERAQIEQRAALETAQQALEDAEQRQRQLEMQLRQQELEHQSRMDELEARLAAEQTEKAGSHSTLRTQLDTLRRELEAERAARAEDSTRHREQIDALVHGQDETMARLRSELSAEKTRMAQLDRDRQAAEASRTVAEEAASRLRSELANAQSTATAAQTRAAEALHQAQAAEQRLQSEQSQQQRLREDVTVAQAAARSAEDRLQRLEQQLQEEESQRRAAADEVSRLQRAVAERDAQLATALAAHDMEKEHLQRRVSSTTLAQTAPLQQEIARLQAELDAELARSAETRQELRTLRLRLADTEDQAAKHQLQMKAGEMQLLEKTSRLADLEENHRREIATLKHKLQAAQQDLESMQAQVEHLRELLARERESHSMDMAQSQKELAEAKAQAMEYASMAESDATEKLAEANERLHQLETERQTEKEHGEQEMRNLRQKLAELERQNQEAQERQAAEKSRLDELKQRLQAERQRADQAETMLHEHDAHALKRERAVHHGRPSSDRPGVVFGNMDAKRLSEHDKEQLCLRDEALRAVNMRRLEARMALVEADRRLRAAQDRVEREDTAEARAALARADAERQAAAAALATVNQEFDQLAAEVLQRLQKEEADRLSRGELMMADDDTLSSSNAPNSAVSLQDKIADLERQLEQAGPAAVEAAERNMQALRDRYDHQLEALRRYSDDAQGKVAALETELARLRELRSMESVAKHAALKRLREEVADWMATCLEEADLNESNLMDRLQDGTRLCLLANFIDEVEDELRALEEQHGLSQEVVVDHRDRDITAQIRERELMEVQYIQGAVAGSKQALSNIRAFVEWARGAGINNPDVFQPEDLVEDVDPRRVLEGLLEVARHARGIPLPSSVAAHRALFQPEPPVSLKEESKIRRNKRERNVVWGDGGKE